MIDKDSPLTDVAFAICTALEKKGLRVVMVGGSAATYYSGDAYRSDDIDFVAGFAADRKSAAALVAVMEALGYEIDGDVFHHAGGNPYTVEFPKGPLVVLGDLVRHYDTIRRRDQILHVITPTDCVRDRLAHFYAWNDRSALSVAKVVARAQGSAVDLDEIRRWSARESQLEKFDEFHRVLGNGGAP